MRTCGVFGYWGGAGWGGLRNLIDLVCTGRRSARLGVQRVVEGSSVDGDEFGVME